MINTGLVILNHKNSDWIKKLLESMQEQKLPSVICLVDNSEDEKETASLKQIISSVPDLNIRLITTPNQGYFQGNLKGMIELQEQFSVTHALILNPDISCDDWEKVIEKLYAYFQTDEKCFITGPKITIPGFPIVSSPIIPFLLWREIAYNLFFPLSNPILKYFHTRLSRKSGKVFAVEGSAFMIDCRKAIDNRHYFDHIFLYGEETIFGKIAQKNNLNIYFDNSVEVIHHHPPGKTSPVYEKFLPLSYIEIVKKFYTNPYAIKLFSRSIKHRFKIRKILTGLTKNR